MSIENTRDKFRTPVVKEVATVSNVIETREVDAFEAARNWLESIGGKWIIVAARTGMGSEVAVSAPVIFPERKFRHLDVLEAHGRDLITAVTIFRQQAKLHGVILKRHEKGCDGKRQREGGSDGECLCPRFEE